MKKYILFDLDGTLTDPAEGITNSVAYALEHYGIKVNDKSTLNDFIGPPLADSFVKYYGFDESKAIEAISVYREYFSEKGIFENRLYDGVSEMLDELVSAGKKVILATSKPEVFAEKILKHFSIDKYFAFVCGSLLNNTRTDKHDVIEHIVSELKINRSDAVMVGDRLHDIIGGKKSQLMTVGVTYGYGAKDELTENGADIIAASVSELTKIILNI